MAETKLRTNLEAASAQISGLKQRVSPDVSAAATAPAVHKDLSLISLVPKWSGAENSVPLEEFLSCRHGIENRALGRNRSSSGRDFAVSRSGKDVLQYVPRTSSTGHDVADI